MPRSSAGYDRVGPVLIYPRWNSIQTGHGDAMADGNRLAARTTCGDFRITSLPDEQNWRFLGTPQMRCYSSSPGQNQETIHRLDQGFMVLCHRSAMRTEMPADHPRSRATIALHSIGCSTGSANYRLCRRSLKKFCASQTDRT
jgi:hypothetical protein